MMTADSPAAGATQVSPLHMANRRNTTSSNDENHGHGIHP